MPQQTQNEVIQAMQTHLTEKIDQYLQDIIKPVTNSMRFVEHNK